LSDTLMCSWRAIFADVMSSSRATCRNTEMRRRERRWDSEVRPVRCSIYFIISDSVVPSDSKQLSQTLLMESIQSPHIRCLRRDTLTQMQQVSGIYGAWCRVSGACRSISVLETSWLHRQGRYGVLGLDDIDHPMIVNCQGKQSCRLIRQYYRPLKYLVV